MAYLILCVLSGLAGGFVGKVKGSSFWLWLVVATVLPVLGVVAALLYRVDRDELRRQCPNCGKVCTRCGAELEFPDAAIAPESGAASMAR